MAKPFIKARKICTTLQSRVVPKLLLIMLIGILGFAFSLGMFQTALAEKNNPPGPKSGMSPTANDDAYGTNEDTQLVVNAATGVLNNDKDPENDQLFAVIGTAPAHGSLFLSGDGSFTYTPVANYFGPDSFTYRAFDSTSFSNLATVTLTITSVNDPPVANNDIYSTSTNVPLNVALPGVLGNDTDVEGDTITAAVVANPTHGMLTLNANGSFSYTPAINYFGADSFTYQASDGKALSNVATVTINVNLNNTPPTAVNDSYSTPSNTALNIAAAGVLANDTDPDGNTLTAKLVAGPAHGTFTLNADGSFSYNPTAGYAGTDSFTYKASDPFSDSNTATVTINVTAVSLPKLTINDVQIVEGNSGTSNLIFSVTLSPAAASNVTVNYATSDGSAVSPSDYLATSGTLTFAPNETSKTISVTINGDTLQEGNESFYVNLTSSVNALIAKTQGTGTIINDDDTHNIIPADLAPQLRVSPDREFALQSGGLVSYTLVIKNIGAGQARQVFAQLPIDPNLEVAFATFSDPKAWLQKIVLDVDQPYLQISMPSFDPAQTMTATVAFHAKATAVAGSQVTTRFMAFWDDDSGVGRKNLSNAVHFNLTTNSTRNDSNGAVQIFTATGEPVSTTLKLNLIGDFYSPYEKVDLWYTNKNRESTSLGYGFADKDGKLIIEVTLKDLQPGESYAIAGFGARSAVTGSTLVAVTADAAAVSKIYHSRPLSEIELYQYTILKRSDRG